jgi:hypothetical protein
VFADTKTKVASLGEVALLQLVFFDLEATLQNFLCFRPTDGDVNSNLLVTANTERSDGVASFACGLNNNFISHFPSIFLRPESELQRPYCRPESGHLIVPALLQHV